MRVHLEAAARHSEFARRELVGPSFPENLRYLWNWFMELHAARSYGPNGPNPIGYREIEAWATVMRNRVSPAEVDMLRGMDLTWMAGLSKDDD